MDVVLIGFKHYTQLKVDGTKIDWVVLASARPVFVLLHLKRAMFTRMNLW